ncbi:MAG TPA: hypothetical protein VFF36_02485 [Planctomycetota bacterium]|jgi:hypothetical protein|nr:hypothetical protein [Planctomycetota bacterium]
MKHVGPLSLTEHVAWFLALSLVVFLVYNALRVDSVRTAARLALRRWLVFVAGTVVLALLSHAVEELL